MPSYEVRFTREVVCVVTVTAADRESAIKLVEAGEYQERLVVQSDNLGEEVLAVKAVE